MTFLSAKAWQLVVVVVVVFQSNATLTAKFISYRPVTHMYFLAFLTPVLTHLSFQSHRLLFSHASAEVRGENTPERKLASTGSRTHIHQVMSPTRSPLSHRGGALRGRRIKHRNKDTHKKILMHNINSAANQLFLK